MPKVFASYYIVYVGIAVAAVTAPAFEQLNVGAAAFWFGFATLILLLILVTLRYTKYPEIPASIRVSKQLTAETEELLVKAITECKAQR